MARASSSNTSHGAAVLGKGAHIRGRIAGDGDLRVEGSISGDVALKGDISATEAVTIRASARVAGAIRGSSISIEEGASVSGRIEAEFELPPELGGKGGR
jgi:cytoskeletal protein CcmA (bactofilin family)